MQVSCSNVGKAVPGSTRQLLVADHVLTPEDWSSFVGKVMESVQKIPAGSDGKQ